MHFLVLSAAVASKYVCIVINRKLIQAINKPWLIEPSSAERLALIALDLLHPNSVATPVGGWAVEEAVPFTKDGVFVLPVNGPLMKYENCGSPGTSNMIESLKQAISDPNIEAIVLQIDSPGGTVDGTKAFADAVKASTKPVVTFVDGMMASAAIWIGSSSTEVVASSPHDMVGSIGTMMQWADFTEAYKQRGVKIHTAYATQSTDKNRMLSKASESGNYTELITTMLDPVNDAFTSTVMANRNGKIDLAKENVLTGKIYMAKDAIKYGLVDKIGNLDTAIKRAKSLAATKQKQMQTNATAFALTLAAAKAPAFELVDNVGFALTEEHLNNVEAALTAAQTEASNLQAQLDDHVNQLATANNELNTIQATVTDHEQTNARLQAEIQELSAQVVKMGGQPANVKPDPAAAKDPVVNDADKYLTSADREKRAMMAKLENK